ncbi:hypothetical protein PHYPSEUDO_007327 [Phytophthora pseudosyringae]|uniref:Uncharacterized protein n=1 Tax=Phytophthora pseudosyringae TaxID=221518 RepID=A0A8T1VGK3_9STRA|nr:hypothetical protein PHYPSEUDO_007327 [Phytophthora pseudosyringae]
MADGEQLRVSGFKRILVRLDEGTRRKYCCRALEEDLQRVKSQVRACAAAVAEAKQVEDATRKLHASQRAAVSSELLAELETLQRQLETTTTRLISGRTAQNGTLNVAEEVKAETAETAEPAETSTFHAAKTLARQIVLSQELETAVHQIRQLERLMPVLKEEDDKKTKWWKKHVQKVVAHTLELVSGGGKEDRVLVRLEKALKKIKSKCPELKKWHKDVQLQIAEKQGQGLESAPPSVTKSKKKRAIALPDDGETARTSVAASSAKAKNATSGDEKKGESAEKARALLHRCSREVRTLRDKFELGAYDVNLSRMVTVVDSLWSGLEHSEVVSLTTALFTLVETVEKVVNQAKRRDRLACLESVLGVVLGSPKLQLTARRKTMVEEYANNCRQSLEHLNRQSRDSSEEPSASTQNEVPAATRGQASKADGGAWPKSHVRFG